MSDATACAGALASSVPCPHCDVLLGLQDTVHVEGSSELRWEEQSAGDQEHA